MKAGALAKLAIAEHPDWSDRRLAHEYGLAAMTIARARKTLAPFGAPENRRGKDGKSYPVAPNGAPENVAPKTKANGAPKKRKTPPAPAPNVASVTRADLSLSAQEKFDAALRHAKRKLELEFDQRVLDECKLRIEESILPAYRKDLVDAAATLRSRNGILPLAMFKKILSCLHPDRVGPELQQRYQDAFTAFKALERVILSEAEMPTPEIDFPRTWAETRKRKTA